MTDDTRQPRSPARARVAYARVLAVCCPLVLTLTVAGFALYMSGLVAPAVPMADLPRLWAGNAWTALQSAGVSQGWGWLSLWRRSDMLCLACLALLTVGTPVACATAMVQYVRRREYALALIAFLQVLVLVAAMSGLLVVRA